MRVWNISWTTYWSSVTLILSVTPEKNIIENCFFVPISDLEAYTEYELRIQAFTTQVSNGGFGMLSPPMTFQTAEGCEHSFSNDTDIKLIALFHTTLLFH